MTRQSLEWTLARLDAADEVPQQFFPAQVPGAAQQDYARANGWEPFYQGLHAQDYAALEDCYWLYRAPLFFTLEDDQCASVVFRGIDYRYQIRVADELLCDEEGMFHPVRLDVSRFANRPTFLEVLVFPAPKTGAAEPPSRAQAAHSCKPAACYGWDWHPRLLSVGIWEEAYLQIENRKCVQKLELAYRLTDDLSDCSLRADIKTQTDCKLLAQIFAEDGLVTEQTLLTAEQRAVWNAHISDPHLWYPVGCGAQPMYTLVVSTLSDDGAVLETKTRRFGLRRVRLVMNEGSWNLPHMPKSRSDAPATLEVNGIRLFAKGSNWVNAHVFPGEMNADLYDRLLTLAQEANMNILRVWGGGFVNKEDFFELCDEKGLMVWQEFPLACNEYPDDEDYLAVLETEATAILRRLRTHPCVCMWCGGNELFNAWSGMTDQHHALRLLDGVCYREDRFTPFLMTSPLNGMAHGHYLNCDESDGNTEFITTLSRSHCTAYPEFGAPSMSAYEDLKQFMPEADVEDCSPDNPHWGMHHGFGAWREESWVRKPEVSYYFGGFRDTEDLCKKTQFIQAMCYRSNFEEMRRQWPHCSMALNWCFNEPWPTAANNNLISWNGRPKPAYFAVQQALRPILASLAVTRHLWWSGERFEAQVWMLNDSLLRLEPASVRVFYRLDAEEHLLATILTPELAAQTNTPCGSVCFQLPDHYAGQIHLRLVVEGHPERSSEYTYLCRQTNAVSASGMLNV